MQTLNVLDNRFSPFNTYSTLSTDALVAETFTDTVFDKRQMLALMTQLQTTLDIDELLNIFAIEVTRYIDFSGLYFKSLNLNTVLPGSRKAKKEQRFELKVDDNFIGTLTYGINSPISLTNFKVLEQLHQCLLHPIKNAIAYHAAMQLAMQDGLTGLGNRRYFDEQLKRSMHNANRHHSLVGLVLGDLNKFKAINDTYGHIAGDNVLQEFANVLRLCTRDSDSLFRFGGDEFAIIVENANDSALTIIENRINLSLANNLQLNKYQLGCSIGSTFMNRADNELSFFERADEILYRRKMKVSTHLSVV
ncbi:GGDEF domain-containing protein [Colwellia psychrerythraea]|uniref:diguanylate cyclase n=1 Tax=Colwellia psychrerythraea TaxID=28229 RepID=A0A1Y5ERE2_COLPS|nr:GGDEF domain-containing protein [Colwellia psychrerythraea]